MGYADEGIPKYTKMTLQKHYNAPAILYYQARLLALKTTPKIDLVLLNATASMTIVHLEWNLIFLLGRMEQSSHMTWTA